MKKLITCGCSWMSRSIQVPNSHYSELLAADLQYELTTYALPGMSNGGIALQIEQAIRDKPDLILFNTTSFDRIEFSISNLESAGPSYHNYDEATYIDMSVAPHNCTKGRQTFISSNLVTLIPNARVMREVLLQYGMDTSEILKKYHALQEWFKFMYHPPMKLKTDRWIMYAVLSKLRDSNIPYVFVQDDLGLPDVTWTTPILNKKWGTTIPRQVNFNDPGYHTTPEQQIEIFNLIKERL